MKLRQNAIRTEMKELTLQRRHRRRSRTNQLRAPLQGSSEFNKNASVFHRVGLKSSTIKPEENKKTRYLWFDDLC